MDNLFFQDNSRIYNINLSNEVYEQMLCYCNKANSYETGGVLEQSAKRYSVSSAGKPTLTIR